MAVWRSFMHLVHLIGALGCLALTAGFAAQGHPARAVFYGLCTMAFAVALAHRMTHRQPTTSVVDLRDPIATVAPSTPVGKVARPH